MGLGVIIGGYDARVYSLYGSNWESQRQYLAAAAALSLAWGQGSLKGPQGVYGEGS